jgi:cell division protein FtsW
VSQARAAGPRRAGARRPHLPELRRRTLLDRPLTSYLLVLGSAMALLGLGLPMVLSASSVTSYATTGSSFTLVERQLLWAAIGVPAMLIASRLSVRTWRRLAVPAMALALLLLVLVLVPGIGVEVNGNRNWIDVGGPFRLQPAEAAKLALVLWGAEVLVRKRNRLEEWRELLVPLLPVTAVILALVLGGGDLGTAVVLMAIAAALLFVAGAPLRVFAMLGLVAASLVTYLSISAPHRLDRFDTWLNPSMADPLGSGLQYRHGLYALGSGGWWGLGLGASREKWGRLPEAHTDFIYAVIGEELGLAGTLTVLLLFGVLAYAGVRIALRTTEPFVRLAASGATAWIGTQALVNIGAVLGMLPIAGLPLPLVSYGGAALLITLVAVGMLLSFARAEPGAAEALAARRAARRERWVSLLAPRTGR